LAIQQLKVKVGPKGKGHALDIALLSIGTSLQKRSGMARVVEGFQFYLHSHTFIHEWNEPYLPFPSQPKLVLIYQPRRDERSSQVVEVNTTQVISDGWKARLS